MKYIKPYSLTWWASVAPLVAGLILATEPLHGAAGLVGVVRELVGADIEPAYLINAGLAGIGLRAAL